MGENDTAIYYIKVYCPTGEVFSSEALELDDARRQALINLLMSCASGREVLSFNDEHGGVTMFPHAVLEKCVVRLAGEGEDDEGE